MTPLELLCCLALISISAYMAASEIALFSLSRFQLRNLKENFRPRYRKLKKLLGDPGGLLITILVVNEVVNISLTSIITGSISRWRGQAVQGAPFLFIPSWAIDSLLGILISAPIVLFFGEVTPKVIAARANQLVSTMTVGPLTIIYSAFKPVRMLLKRVVTATLRFGDPSTYTTPTRGKNTDGEEREEAIVDESDFLLMLEEGHREGAIQQSELELIKNVFEFDDTPVSSIYTPLAQVQSFSRGVTVKTALASIRGARYSRIPVLADDRRSVLGILYSKDLLRAKTHPEMLTLKLESVMRKPVFVTSSLRLNALFRQLKQHQTHLAIVRGVHDETLGIVTMRDVLDTLFEDLFPEEESDATPRATPEAKS